MSKDAVFLKTGLFGINMGSCYTPFENNIILIKFLGKNPSFATIDFKANQ